MDPPSFTRKILREELRISENELNKYQKILAEKAFKITQKLKEGDSEDAENEEDLEPEEQDEELKGEPDGNLKITDREEGEAGEEPSAADKYKSFMDSLVPVNAEIGAKRMQSIGEDVDLSKMLSKLENNGHAANQLVPIDMNDISEPDDEDIEKMILNEGERALKTRLWNTLNQDWISQEREKKKARKA